MSKFKIGMRIKSRRKDLHLTQEQLAERSNSSVNFISQLERHEKDNVTLRKLSEIASALDLSISDLINYKVKDYLEIENKIEQHSELPKTTQLVQELLSMNKSKAENISDGILKILHNK